MNSKKRLLAIIDLIDKNKKVIDIGTDHGLVPLYLAKNGISKDILATDISKPSLNKLVEALDDETSQIITTKVTNGFQDIKKEENQVAIIAGMGATTIINIIENSLDFAKNLDYMVLSCNINSEKLRTYLLENSFDIKEDFLVYENGKFYDIIKTSFGQKLSYDLSEIYYGRYPIKRHDKILEKKLAIDYKKNKRFLKEINKHSNDLEAKNRIEKKLRAIEEVYDKWR